MKDLLRLHWRLERNHIKRRLGYLRIYFDWAGTITYIYLAAFFLFLAGWYLYDPVGRIPLEIRQAIAMGGQLLLIGVPMFWLFGGVGRAAFTPILLSMADAHYLPLTPLKKSNIIVEQWFWAASRRMVLALCLPVLIYPLLKIFWPAYTLGRAGVTQGAWFVSAIIGLDLQWIIAVPFAWLRRSKILAWFKTLLAVALFILVLAALWRLPEGQWVSSLAPLTGAVTTSTLTGLPAQDWQRLSTQDGQAFVSPLALLMVNSLSVRAALAAATAVTFLLTAIVLRWYSRRSWVPILQQTEHVHTLRTLIRARDKRALQRYRQNLGRGRFFSKLLGRVYLTPQWALSWKNVLGWKSVSLLQLLSLFLPLIFLRFRLSGGFSPAAANPFEALLSPVLYQQFPLALFVLQGFVGLLTSWQEDLQQMEKFRLLPLYPKAIILSTVTPSGLLVGVGWAVALLPTIPLPAKALGFALFFALLQGYLGSVLIAREMLKDPSSYTSAIGPERLVSTVVFLLGPIVLQGSLIAGASLEAGLTAGIAVAAGAVFLWIFFMLNEYTLLRAKYEI